MDEILNAFADMAQRLAAHPLAGSGVESITRTALVVVPATEYASVSLGRHGSFWTVAATDGAARAADGIQYELGSGPCVDAAVDDAVYRTGDLASDSRWPQFGPMVFEETGAQSMLAIRLFVEEDTDLVAALNLYSDQRDAFDEDAEFTGLLLATYGATFLTSAADRSGNLAQAVMSSGAVETAIGILTTAHGISREQGLNLLCIASQRGHCKLVDVATNVVETGRLELAGRRLAEPR